MRFINWVLRNKIEKERLRQISLGYTYEHDDEEFEKDPYHLLNEAQAQFLKGNMIAALALMRAQAEVNARTYMRIINGTQGPLH